MQYYRLERAYITSKETTITAYEILFNNDHHIGILNFTHELGLIVIPDRDSGFRFHSAFEIGPGGDWDYRKEEDFAIDHPEIMPDLRKALSERRIVYDVETVETNIGKVPIEDYRDIKAIQWGFNDYDDLRKQGYFLADGYDRWEDVRNFLAARKEA